MGPDAGPFLVVGLGNPGTAYASHRHNLGACVVERLAARLGVRLGAKRGLSARVAEARLGDRSVLLAVPTTYMNDSGLAVGSLVRRVGLKDLSRLVVVHDELDLPVGRVRVKLGGGTAGHNGLRSIVAHVKDPGFVRVRVGIGRPPGHKDATAYVLSAPSRAERAELEVAVEEAADAVEAVVALGVPAAMNRFNTRTAQGPAEADR